MMLSIGLLLSGCSDQFLEDMSAYDKYPPEKTFGSEVILDRYIQNMYYYYFRVSGMTPVQSYSLVGQYTDFTVRAQYPQITEEAKAAYSKMMSDERRLSDEAWAKALPVVEKEAKEGRPYIPWASRPDDLPQAKIPAFPSAEGGGMFSYGGRGGKVITVTNLNDQGPGSFREACETKLDREMIADSSMPKDVHEKLMKGLRRVLTEEQVEQVLDKYTVGKVAFTLKGYQAIVPNLTDTETAFVLEQLKLAREQAIDYKNMKQISAIFEIYKTKCEQYFNDHGRNWHQMFKDYVNKRKAEKK